VRVYADSSALIKRAVEEADSDALESAIEQRIANGDAILASSLAWVEVSRALRSLSDVGRRRDEQIAEAIDVALSGVAARPVTDDVISLARRVAPPVLRTLDAIHLATAIVLDVEVVVTYDDRLADACRHSGLATSAPGRS
jgi:predicted nucleic acid-binding protein